MQTILFMLPKEQVDLFFGVEGGIGIQNMSIVISSIQQHVSEMLNFVPY
jgi:hypothetical protein